MYNTITTTNAKNATDELRAYCNKLSINESNYLAVTITLPHIVCNQQQKAQLEQILNSISFPFIGAIEYTDDISKANGYHAHLIASNEHLKQIKEITGVHISNNYISKDSWIYYITNNQQLKQFIKWKYAPAPAPAQLEFDFNNQIAESNEITPPTKEKKEINNTPFKRLIKERAKYIHMFLLRALNVFFLMDEVAIRGRGDPFFKKQTIYIKSKGMSVVAHPTLILIHLTKKSMKTKKQMSKMSKLEFLKYTLALNEVKKKNNKIYNGCLHGNQNLTKPHI